MVDTFLYYFTLETGGSYAISYAKTLFVFNFIVYDMKVWSLAVSY